MFLKIITKEFVSKLYCHIYIYVVQFLHSSIWIVDTWTVQGVISAVALTINMLLFRSIYELLAFSGLGITKCNEFVLDKGESVKTWLEGNVTWFPY